MHVGLDLVFLVPGQTGGRETYARELIRALRLAEPDLRMTAFVSRDTPQHVVRELDPDVGTARVPVRASSRSQWALGQIALLPILAARTRPDLLHSLANFAPLFGNIPRVVTIHDLLFRRYPQVESQLMRRGTETLVTAAAFRARRVITGSSTSRDDLCNLGIPAERIDVIPYGLGTTSGAAALPATEVRRRHRLDSRKVLLAVASDLPHKNLTVLVRAQALIPKSQRPLLVLGGQGTDRGPLPQLARELGVMDDVRVLGSLPIGELEALYCLAGGLLFPSLAEGFGLPVLEAMSRNVPVACSDIPVLHEVAGNAALYFDPRDPANVASAMGQLLGDAGLAERLRMSGRHRAGLYSWSATARATLACYRRALYASARSAS